MPDDNKTTNTNQPITEEVPTVGQTNPTTTLTPTPVATPDAPDQAIDTPPPPPMQDGAFSPPPPIVEEKKPEETTATTQETGATEDSQEIPNIPPVITTSDTGGKKPVSKKMIATILGVLVLVGGIGAGVILVQNQQDIREEAASATCAGGVAIGDYACSSATTCVKCTQTERYDYPTFVTADRSNCTGELCYQEIDDPECVTNEDCDTGETCNANGNCVSATSCTSSSSVTRTNDAGGNNATEFKVTQAQLDACHAACPSAYLVVYRYECDRITNLSGGCNDNGVLVKSHAQPGDKWTINNIICGSVQMDVGCFDLSRAYGSLAFASYKDDQPCDPKPSVPGISCSCLNIKAFDDEWNAITNLSSLVVGDVVRFTVAGTATSGSIDKARFTINESLGAEITAKRPGTDEFFVEYTIPEEVSSFTINAELHHATVGWF